MAHGSWEWAEACEVAVGETIRTLSTPQAYISTTSRTSKHSRRQYSKSSFYQVSSDRPLSMNDQDEFSEGEVEKLQVDRKRFLAQAYINSGTLPSETFARRLNQINAKRKAERGGIQVTETSFETEETTTTTVVETTLQDCPCHDGCKVDHGVTRYAKFSNQRTGATQYLQVKEDTGSTVNWISPSVLASSGFDLEDVVEGELAVRDFCGTSFHPQNKVAITLAGTTSKTMHTEFYVAPQNFPFDGVVIGTDFIRTTGHAHMVFLDNVEGSALIVMATKMTETERTTQQLMKVEAERRAATIEQKRQEQRLRDTNSGPKGERQATASTSSSRRRGDREH